MKKLFVVFIVVLMLFTLTMSLAGCAAEAPCEGCGKVAKLKAQSIFGLKMNLCPECSAAASILGGLGGLDFSGIDFGG